MNTRRFSLPAFALLMGLGGLVAAAPAFAQAAPPGPTAPPPSYGAHPPAAGALGPSWQAHRPSAERFVPGRIAFLKAELKITPQQEPQWTKVAEAMRVNAHAIDAARSQFRGESKDAVQALEARGRFAATMAQNNDRLLAAFRPLYQSLSPDQKKMADEILTMHFHHRRFD
ncbi:MAG: Spy/CpxP family protein refolding chaperone [Alphaproteobacteria bacterium]|nr:Spy/CpxP family protein refolding chaperone [Alphaproteobacteria bacterium]